MKPEVLAVLFTLAAAPLQATAGNAIEVLDAWIAEAPPVSKIQAGYLHIRNDSGRNVAITGMECSNFPRTEFHRTVDRDGMASMERQQVLRIAAGETLEMKPGGLHVMLFDPEDRLHAGGETGCNLLFGDRQLPVTLQIRKSAAMHDHSHHHH